MFDKVFVVLARAYNAFAAALLRAVRAYACALNKAVVRNRNNAAFVCDNVFHSKFAFGGQNLRFAFRSIFFLKHKHFAFNYAQKFLFVFYDRAVFLYLLHKLDILVFYLVPFKTRKLI